jgi:hypothetical protein
MLSHEWQKSSRSGSQGDCVELRLGPDWQKSSHSAAQTDCVELRQRADVVQVRDSKLGDASPILGLDATSYASVIKHLKRS